MIATVLAFLASPLGKILKPAAGVLLVLALLGLALYGARHAGYKAGIAHELEAQAKAVEKARKRVLEAEKQSAAITDKAAQNHTVTVEKIKWRNQVLKEEIKVYVPTSVDRDYRLPNGLVLVHDAAASGATLPVAPGGPVEAPSRVTPSQLGSAIADNYGTCYVWQSEALTWRKWYVDQRDLYDKTISAR